MPFGGKMKIIDGLMKKITLLCVVAMLLSFVAPAFGSINESDRFNLVTTSGCNEITLSWNSIPDVQYYWPYQIFEDGSEYPLIDFASKDLTFTHKDLEDGKEYCYIVKATDDKGKEITISSIVCAKTDCSKVVENCTYRMEFVVGSKSYYLDGSSYDQNGSMLTMDSPPVIVNNRTMIPAKYVVDNLKDATIQWDQKTKEVKIIAKRCCSLDKIKPSTLIDVVIIYKIGKNTVNVDGKEQPIDKTNSKIAPMIISGRTMIPFRNLGENLGAVVDYIPNEKRIILDFDCKLKKTPNEDIIDKPPNPVIKTLCGCIDSIIVAAAKGPGVPATVTFLPDCSMSANPMTLKVNSYLSASNSSDPLYNYSDVLDPSSNPATGFPRPTDGWDMPSYVGSWKGQIKSGTTNDRTWCAIIKYYTFGGQNYIVSWEMHPEKEECCTEIVCACIYGYDEDTAPGHIRLFIQDDCLDQPPKLHVFSVPFNKSCTNPPAGSNSYLVYNYIGDYPNGTTTGTVNGVTKKKWCIKYKTNSAGDFLSWEMTPDNCECSCIDTCKGCLVSLTPTPSCNGNIIPQNQWTAVFDFDCNPSTTNDRTTYSQSSVASSTTAGAVYVSLANLWRRCNCGQSTNSKTFTSDSDFNSGIMQSVDHNPTADQLEIQYPVTTTPFPHIWIPNWNDYTVSKVSTVSPYPVLARYRVSSKTVNTNSSLGPSRTTVDKEGNCWVAIRDTGSVVKILNIPVDNNNDGLVTSQNETDLKAWGQDDAIQYEVILDHANQGVYKPTISGQNFTGAYTTVSGPRALAIDENNTLWIGTRDTRKVYKISQNLTNNPPSATLNTYFNIANATYVAGQNCQPYGAVVDKCGSLWITSNNGIVLKLANASTSATANPVFITGNENFKPYSLTLDPNSDYLYLSSFSSNEYIYTIPTAVNANGSSWNSQTTIKYSLVSNISGGIVRGVAFDRFGHLWSVNSNGNIRRFSCSNGFATLQSTGVNYSIPIGWSQPSGIAMDTDGKMWVGFISNTSGTVFFTPNGGSSACNLTRVDVMGGHYTYSDMTGSIVNSITAPTGYWTTPVIDAGCDNPAWAPMQITNFTPHGSSMEYYCSTSQTGITGSWSTFAPMMSPFIPPPGQRYLRIMVLFRSGELQSGTNCPEPTSPYLYDLTVNWKCQTSVNCCADLCLDSAGKIVSITPRVGQEPCCVSSCQWTSCGVVQDITFSQDHNTAFITVKDCSTGAINHYSGDVNLYANNASQITWATPTLVKYGVGNCAKYCIKASNTIPPEYTITEWIGISPTDPCCCKRNCCTDWQLSIPAIEPNNILSWDNVEATNCANHGTRVTFGRLVLKNNCDTQICVKFVGNNNNFFIASDATNFSSGIAMPQPVTIPAGGTLSYLYGSFIVPPDCDADDKSLAFTIKQVDCTTGDEIPECEKKVYVKCCPTPTTSKFFCDCLKVVSKVTTTPTGVFAVDGANTQMFVYIDSNNPVFNQIAANSFISVAGLTDISYGVTPGVRGLTIRIAQGFECSHKNVSLTITANSQTAFLNGNQIQMNNPVLQSNSELLVSLTDFVDHLTTGSTSSQWISSTQTIIFTFCDAFTIKCQIGSTQAILTIPSTGNGQSVSFSLSSPPQIVGGLGYVPVKSIVEFLGGSYICQNNPAGALSCSIRLMLCPCTEDSSCCRWSLGLWADPGAPQPFPTEMCPGETVTRSLALKNDCPAGSQGIVVTVVSPYPNCTVTLPSAPFTLNAGQLMPFNLTFTMPQNCTAGQEYTIAVVVQTQGCGEKIFSSKVKCKTCETCCNYVFENSFYGEFPASLCPGKRATTKINIMNKCETRSLTLNVSGNGNTTITPQPSVTLLPGQSQVFTIVFTMPGTVGGACNVRSASASYTIKVDGCTDLVKSFQIRCTEVDCSPCCDWDIQPSKTSQRMLYLCPGETATIDAFEIVNNCPQGSAPIEFTITLPSSTNILAISPTTFTLNPGEKKALSIKLKMPDCRQESTAGVDFPFNVTTKPKECSKSVKFTIYCKNCENCCDFQLSDYPIPKQMCYNEEYRFMPTITNKCSKAMKFTITPVQNTTINGSTSPFTSPVAIPANGTLSFTVVYKMPQCTPPQKTSFTWTIKPENCEAKKITNTVECKSCDQCCQWEFASTESSINMTNAELCAGEKLWIKIKVKNLCKNDKVTIDFSPDDSTTTTITPASLEIQPGQTAEYKIDFTMPKCTPGGSVKLSYRYKACGKDTGQNWYIKCKDCWCGKTSSTIKLTKIDIKAGTMEGTMKSGSISLNMKFSFDGNDRKWSLLEIGKCYEICYETRSTRAGEYFFALDYREVTCPKSAGSGGRPGLPGVNPSCN